MTWATPRRRRPGACQKKNYKKRLKWLGIAAAVVLAVVAVALLWDHGSFDGLRRAVIYRQAQKDETGCAQLYRYAVREERGVHIARWEPDYGLRRADQRPR